MPVNHSERAYIGFTAKMEGASSNLRYYKIANGQNLDNFLPITAGDGVQGYDILFVPVNVYFNRAMDLM